MYITYFNLYQGVTQASTINTEVKILSIFVERSVDSKIDRSGEIKQNKKKTGANRCTVFNQLRRG